MIAAARGGRVASQPMVTAEANVPLIACHDCDRLHRAIPLRAGEVLRCRCCGAILDRLRVNSLDRTLAFTMASAVLFVVANTFPFMSFRLAGRVQESTLVTGVVELWGQGFGPLGTLVLIASIAAPAGKIAALLSILVPLKLGWRPRRVVGAHRFLVWVRRWSMMEVYLLGVGAAVVKLSQMAEIVIGPGCWAFAALIVSETAASLCFDPRVVWQRMEARA